MKKYSWLHGTPKAWDEQRKPHGGSGGGTSTTTQEIPVELKPLATDYTNRAMALANTDWQGYDQQRYADMNAMQNMGAGMTADRALNGSQTMNNAEGSLNQFIQGGNTNPYLDSMYDQAAGKVANSVNTNFAQAGRYGSGAHTGALTEGLGNMATDMYGGAYAQDQANRMQAIGMAPQFGDMAYKDASQMLNAGQIMQDQSQNNLDFGYQQYLDQQNDPYKKLAAMSGVFGTNLGASSSTQSSGGGK